VFSVHDACCELCSEEDVLAFLGVQGEPLTEEVFVVAVDVGGVPEVFAQLVGLVEESEAFGVGEFGAVGCGTVGLGSTYDDLRMLWCDAHRPISPIPILVTCGPFLPRARVGSRDAIGRSEPGFGSLSERRRLLCYFYLRITQAAICHALYTKCPKMAS
jgi:hypothetical protein